MNKSIKQDQIISKKAQQVNMPLMAHPELIPLIIDVVEFSRKWTTPRVARTLGISKQAVEGHVQRRRKNRE